MSPCSVRCSRPGTQAANRLAAAAPTGCRSWRCVWTHDFAPAHNTAKRDVASRIVVGMLNEAASTTGELCLRAPVLLVNKPTRRAGLRSVGGVHLNERNASEFRLVRQKLSKLMKRPGMHHDPLGLAEPYPLADAGELLHGDATTGALSHSHNALRDDMIDIRHEESFLPPTPVKQASGGGRSFFLQTLAQVHLPATIGQEIAPALSDAIARGGDVDDPQVYAKESGRRPIRLVLEFYAGEQKPLAVPKNQISLADLVSAYQGQLTGAAGNPQTFDSADGRPNRDRRGGSGFRDLPGQASSIEWLPASCSPSMLGSAAARVRIGDFSDDADGRLGRQAKFGSDLRVEQPVRVVFAEDLALEHASRQPVGCGITGLQSRRQCNDLALRRQQPDLYRQLHIIHGRTHVRSMQVHDRVIEMFGYRRFRSDRAALILSSSHSGSDFGRREMR